MASAGLLALVDFTAGEILGILVFGLIILGPERLPQVARTLGEWMAKLRRLTSNLQHEMRDVLDDPAMQPLREVGEFVAQPRKKLTEMALAAEAEAAASQATVPAPEPEPKPEPEPEPAPVPTDEVEPTLKVEPTLEVEPTPDTEDAPG